MKYYVNPETIYTQTTKTDSEGCNDMYAYNAYMHCIHTHTHIHMHATIIVEEKMLLIQGVGASIPASGWRRKGGSGEGV